MRIDWIGFENSATKDMVEIPLQKSVSLLPWWVEYVRVTNLGDVEKDHSSPCQIRCQQEYRQIGIEFFLDFFDCSSKQQELILRHEFIHSLLAPITDWVKQELIYPLESKNKELYDALFREFARRFESVTQDLAITLGER